MNTFYTQLESITVGRTTCLFGLVITRWSSDLFEVGTWGRKQQTIHEAADALSMNVRGIRAAAKD